MKLKWLVLTGMLACQPLYAADLLACFKAAQHNDAQYAAAQAKYLGDLEKLPQARALLKPTVSLSANSTYNDTELIYESGSSFQDSDRRYNTHGYSLNITQPLYRTQNWLGADIAEIQVAMAQLEWQQASQELILRVAQAYFDRLMAADEVRLLAAQKQALQQQLQQAQAGFEVGSVAITDVHEAQARFDLISFQQIAADNALDMAGQHLQQLTASQPDAYRPLEAQFQLQQNAQPLAEWQQLAQQQSLPVVAGQANLSMAAKRVEQAMTAGYPTVDLVAGYNKTHAGGSVSLGVGSETTGKSLGVQLNWDLYAGGAIASRQKEAEANLLRVTKELEDAAEQAGLQVREAYLGVVNGLSQIAALQQVLQSSRQQLEATRQGQQAGVRTNVDVLNAMQQVYAAERDLYQIKYQYLMSQLQLQALVGDLDQRDVTVINAYLQ